PPKVSASDVQACPLLFPDLREFSTSLIVSDTEKEEGDMYSGRGGGGGCGRQSGLQALSVTALWSSTALPFILRPLNSLDSLTIGGTTVEPFLAQIPHHCPRLTRFEYIGRLDRLGAPLWIDFLSAYGRLTHLRISRTDLADAVVLSLPRSCPSLQNLILPREVSQITWQAVSALVEHLAQLQVLNAEALTIPGEFFGTRVHLDITEQGEGEEGGRNGASEVVLKPWACQDTLQELTLHNVFLSYGADDYALFRQRMWSLRRLRKLGIFGEPIALECFVVDCSKEATNEAEKKRTSDDHRFPCLETFNIPEFETPMGLEEAQALFGQMPLLREPKLPFVSFVREAEEWFTEKYGETEDGDDN
ncbi:hypothetical protein BGZ82_010887, partial [Podila clonocystis]